MSTYCLQLHRSTGVRSTGLCLLYWIKVQTVLNQMSLVNWGVGIESTIIGSSVFVSTVHCSVVSTVSKRPSVSTVLCIGSTRFGSFESIGFFLQVLLIVKYCSGSTVLQATALGMFEKL